MSEPTVPVLGAWLPRALRNRVCLNHIAPPLTADGRCQLCVAAVEAAAATAEIPRLRLVQTPPDRP